MNASSLIPAVLTYVRQVGGYATKTKLVKLLYLLDIEAYRINHSTLTGFDWVFHLYGPWAQEYETVLTDLQTIGAIALHSGSRNDLDTVFIDACESVPLSNPFPRFIDELRARRIIEAWAERPTGELLDYVYFHTEPMREARRGELLDFTSVLKEESPPEYRRAASGATPEDLKKQRRELREAMKSAASRPTSTPIFQPRYDDEFWHAVDTIERDPD